MKKFLTKLTLSEWAQTLALESRTRYWWKTLDTFWIPEFMIMFMWIFSGDDQAMSRSQLVWKYNPNLVLELYMLTNRETNRHDYNNLSLTFCVSAGETKQTDIITIIHPYGHDYNNSSLPFRGCGGNQINGHDYNNSSLPFRGCWGNQTDIIAKIHPFHSVTVGGTKQTDMITIILHSHSMCVGEPNKWTWLQ